MPAFQKFNGFVQDLAQKIHNLNADVLKLALTDVAPVATNTVLANITQITAANGYTAGGTTVGTTSATQTNGILSLIGNAVTFTASGGTMANFRYGVLYNSTAASGNLIGWWDNSVEVTLLNTQSFKFSFSGTDTGGTILTLF